MQSCFSSTHGTLYYCKSSILSCLTTCHSPSNIQDSSNVLEQASRKHFFSSVMKSTKSAEVPIFFSVSRLNLVFPGLSGVLFK